MKRKSVDKIARAISVVAGNADRVHLAERIGEVLAKRWNGVLPFDHLGFAGKCHTQGGVEPRKVDRELLAEQMEILRRVIQFFSGNKTVIVHDKGDEEALKGILSLCESIFDGLPEIHDANPCNETSFVRGIASVPVERKTDR